MKNFLLDILPKIQRYSQKLDDLTLLTSQHWVFIDDDSDSKVIYLFRKNNELLISTNGVVDKAKWEYLGNQSILVGIGKKSYLYKHGFFDKNILALKLDSSVEFAVFVNENKFDDNVNSIKTLEEFIDEKYIQLEPSREEGLSGKDEGWLVFIWLILVIGLLVVAFVFNK